jgi:tetratricopeptide (TPR) repeat protein
VPEPTLEGLEDAVADQLRETRAVLDETLSGEDVGQAERAEAYGELGRLYHAYEITEPAEIAYRNARALAPGDFRWAYYHAYLLQQVGRFQEAEEAYARALKIQPTNVAAMIHLGEVYLELGRFDRTEAAAERVLDIAPGQPAAIALLGRAALAREDTSRAIELLERALAAVPRADRLHYPLGMAYRAEGNLEKAREHLGQIGTVGIRPPDPLIDDLDQLQRGSRVHVLRGRMAFRAGHFEDAEAEFRQAVEADPEDLGARVNLGSALGQGDDPEGAIEQFRRALELDPDNMAAHFNLGVLLLRRGQVEEAIEHHRAAVAGAPGDGEAHLELARALRAAGRSEEALESLRKAVELAPFQEKAQVELASLLVSLGRYADAVERLDVAHALMPRSGSVAGAYARMLAAAPDAELRDGARALDLARRVFEAEPTAFNAETVALALAEEGRCDEAAGWLRRVLGAEAESASGARLVELQGALARYEAGPPCRPPAAPGR